MCLFEYVFSPKTVNVANASSSALGRWSTICGGKPPAVLAFFDLLCPGGRDVATAVRPLPFEMPSPVPVRRLRGEEAERADLEEEATLAEDSASESGSGVPSKGEREDEDDP
jgi:hypothetical protein